MNSFSSGIFKLLVTIALFWAGGQMLWTGVSNHKPVLVTASALGQKQPDAKWIEIIHARLNLANPCYISVKGSTTPSEVLIPILPSAEQTSILIPAFLHSRKKEYLDPLKKMADLADSTVSGVVESGISLSDATVNAAKDHYGAKALGKFLIIEDGEKPSWLKGLGLLALAFLSLYWMLGGFESAGNPKPTPPLPTPDP